jgi:hypothetical protein
MTPVSTLTSSLLTDIAAQSWIELLAAYGVELTATSVRWENPTDDPILFGVIGFSGPGMRATCLIGAERALVEASCRDPSHPRDWIGELANQLVGRIKMKLISHGVSVTMTTPLALSGVRVTPMPRTETDPLAFTSRRGRALLWVELETDDDLELTPSRPLSVVPGDRVF